MIISVVRRKDGKFLIEAAPEAGKPFKGIKWGTHFEYEGKEYIAQQCDPYHKDLKLTYVVEAVEG